MRSTTRLFAAVQSGSQYLQAGAPTGITGLLTHASPRGTLLYLYSSTLDKLKQFPEHSVYRQSTEALTKHRMAIVEAAKPAGLEEWQKRVQPIVDQHPEAFRKIPAGNSGDFNIVWKLHNARADLPHPDEHDDFKVNPGFAEGIKTEHERRNQGRQLQKDVIAEQAALPEIEDEPSLTRTQINEIEAQIGAGLIEEVIQVAEGEKELVDILYESQVWDDLVEKPQENQWRYAERDTHTGTT